jgi:hypothetical protein
MKKLIKTIFSGHKFKKPLHDPIEELIHRLCDPTDQLYDEGFTQQCLKEKNDNK